MVTDPKFYFSIQIIEHVKVSHKPTPFLPEKRSWVAKEMDLIEKAGIVKQVAYVHCVNTLILVKKGQQG